VARTASAAAEHAETQRAYLLGDNANQKEAGSIWCEAIDVDFYLLRSRLARALAEPASTLQPSRTISATPSVQVWLSGP
jgi:hypothetical protein